jgi:hypothetical protein
MSSKTPIVRAPKEWHVDFIILILAHGRSHFAGFS